MNATTPIDNPFPDSTLSAIEKLLDSLVTRPKTIRDVMESIEPPSFNGGNYESPALFLEKHLLSTFQPQTSAERSRLRSAAIAALCLCLPQRIESLRLPDSVLNLYSRTLAMICNHLTANPDNAYPTPICDYFLKDARIALGQSIPCNAQYVDIAGRVRLRSLVKHAVFTGDISPLRRLAKSAIRSSWYEIHTEPRDLADFNEQGWERCYGNIAQLLTDNPSIGGMVGTSWFYDPQLIDISPRIAYLQHTPILGGAMRIRNGSAPIHTERAVSKSETRRRLYNEGKYLPICYTIVWPRDKLLAWFRSTH